MKNLLKIAILPVAVTSIAAVILYYAVSTYMLGEAEEHIQNVILSNRGLHHYIQRNMHPSFFRDMEDGYIRRNYYNPVIFSSTYIVRVLQGYYNEERKRLNYPEVYYKMAALNPRNPVNLADKDEARLIKLFNERRDLKSYEEILNINGKKYLTYSMPFLETTTACLRCHGKRKDAPVGLQKLYPGEGGFGDKVGNIRAIESIRVPVDSEFVTAAIVTGSTSSGIIAFLLLLIFSSRLQVRVNEKTEHLKREIAENIRAKQEIADTLRAKEVLLSELHHRVKNNMAVISSFLEMQSMSAADEAIKHELDKSVNRIRAMSLLHENLYCNGDLASIDLKDYIQNILQSVAASFGFADNSGLIKLNVGKTEPAINKLIHIGLIINEITMNSFKHAFKGIEKPELSVSMTQSGDRITLVMADNGTGKQDHLDGDSKQNLGMEIIKTLVLHIGGVMVIDNSKGTSYKITFPAADREPNGKT